MVTRFLWGLLVLLIAAGVVCIFLPKCNKVRELQRKRTALLAETKAVEAETAEFRVFQERFRTEPEFVEATARGLGMVKPHETVFKFTNARPSAAAQP